MIKQFREFGTGAHYVHPSADFAKSAVYRKANGEWPSTPLVFPENPFNNQVLQADWILDFGCGCGRNLRWVMENTHANYVGVEPNHSLRQWFHSMQNGYDPFRVTTVENPMFMVDGLADVVVSTFVFQHLGYKFTDGTDTMDLTDITKLLMRKCRPGAVWIMYENEAEGPWIDRWLRETGISLDVYFRDYYWYPDLADRGPHHLMIWRT